jgi:acetyltransferase-like isoleucine patch superfamily enzyme
MKPNFLRRLGMKCLLWLLKDEQASRTCELNRVLYERAADGRQLARFSHPQMEVGEHTYGLRRECFIAYHPGDRVRIGKYCSVADGVRFVFGGHSLNTISTFPFKAVCFGEAPHADASSKGDIVVGHDVWIGAGAVILSGVKIGNGAVIAAGAVVTANVPSYAVVGGVPARVIKMRFGPEQVAALEKICWWNWPLENIRSNLDFFYGAPDEFIRRHLPASPEQ